MSTLPISVFIIAKNEADRIGVTINSVKGWVDEVIVIDSGSSDDTMAVASALGARALYHAWNGYGLQKRFGEEQCRNRWILNLDADEEVTPALAEEIKVRFASGAPAFSGFVLRVRDLLPGEQALAPFAHTNYVLRLYDFTKARFSDSPVHDTVILREGVTAMLSAPVLHRSFRSLAHALEKMNYYTSMQAENLRRKGLKYPLLRLLTEFPLAFLKTYVLRGYILRGRRGFINAVIYGFTRFVRVAKYCELTEVR